jgi:hypothetical protein
VLQPLLGTAQLAALADAGRKRPRTSGFYTVDDEDDEDELSEWDEDLDLKEDQPEELPPWHDALAKGRVWSTLFWKPFHASQFIKG